MAFLSLVRPLEESHADVLRALAKRHGFPSVDEPGKLGPAVSVLSALYNGLSGGAVALDARAHLGARLGFSFPRDVPKGAAAVRELVGTGLLALRGEKLRVLDVGSGLGAMSFGVLRALEAAGQTGEIDATFVDADARALSLARELAGATTDGAVRLNVTTRAEPLGAKLPPGPFDLVIAGQVLSELDEHAAPEGRVTLHAALVERLLGHVSPTGALVLVEPALRDRARHLHAVRDAVVAQGRTPFAPCLHSAACPARLRDDDWCHEDLPVDLPPWLVPVARAAGLRHEGLSLAYLVLRPDGRSLATLMPSVRLRAVSSLLRSKGKEEIFACGTFDGEPAKRRLRRLDRHASEANAAWSSLARGDLFDAGPLDGERLSEAAHVRIVEAP
ncbi:MAG: hypothetical protein IPK71_24095 [Myxococcales bacterium]|nr:hypothetical protein [Myxococcales bacterium]